jgi:uracil-DNA glycosylase family 4
MAAASALTARPALAAASCTSLSSLHKTIVTCRACPRLVAWREQVAREKRRAFADQEYWGRPVPGFGDSRARLLIVGLAPAAHGANRTGRMFTGDQSGDWLYEALHRFGFASRADACDRNDGLRLTDCYITASARCAPPANRPTPKELATCRPWLEREVMLLGRVSVVLALGAIGHDAWLRAAGWRDRLAARERPRFRHGASVRLAGGPWLVSSYHPSRQNTNTGRLTRGMWHGVFERVRGILDDGSDGNDGSER